MLVVVVVVGGVGVVISSCKYIYNTIYTRLSHLSHLVLSSRLCMSLVVSRRILIVSQYFIYINTYVFFGFFLYSDYISSE